MGTNIFAFVIVLGVLIFFHELGHFLVARLFGVGVERFSLGFGPRIFGKKIGITDYRISAVPLGGYVKMVGEEPDAEVDPADVPISFTHKHVLKRFFIVVAGPAFNILLAVLIFYGIFQISGTVILKPIIGEAQSGTPAQAAGLAKGDEIVSIDGRAIESWDEMATLIADSKGAPLEITFRRNGMTRNVTVTPELKTTKNIFGEDIPR
ncbi:MAG: M50 family metallopeptidase, partial [Desulfobacterales bacterium]